MSRDAIELDGTPIDPMSNEGMELSILAQLLRDRERDRRASALTDLKSLYPVEPRNGGNHER